MPETVLITGVSQFLAGHLAARLAANPQIKRVIGVDTVPPARDLLRRMGRTEFVRTDIRNSGISKLLAQAEVDTVVHAAVTANLSLKSALTAKETNVIGSMQLLAACRQVKTIRKLVVKSSSAVYGTSPRDPAVFTEDMTPHDIPPGGYAKDAIEIEEYVRGFNRQRPDVLVTTLRFTNIIGPQIDTLLTRYFASPVVPTVFGQDARIQLTHTQDALAVLARATLVDLPGVFNVGGPGVLLLSQAIRRAGRVALPLFSVAVPTFAQLARSAGLGDFSPEQLRLLSFGRVVDITRLVNTFGYTPEWTTEEAFHDYLNSRNLRPLLNSSWLQDLKKYYQATFSRSRQ